MAVIKSIDYSFPCCTNRQMVFHGFISLSKEVLTVMSLFNNTIRNVLFSFFKTTNTAFVGQVNSVCEKTRNRNFFIKYRFVDFVNRRYIYSFFVGQIWSNHFISIKFFNGRARKVSCDFTFSLYLFFLKRNLNISRHSKNLRKKLCLART